MKAAVVQKDKTIRVEEKTAPKPGPKDVLLKVLVVGQNPTDWKHALYFSKPGDIIGCDYVGEVVELGKGVPQEEVHIGQVRWGFMRGGVSPDRGAFAEYITARWDVTSVVPGNLSPTQAASIPIPFSTAVMGLYITLQLPEPSKLLPGAESHKWFLVWSGATAVGQFAIQLAKASGYKVAATASPKRWDLLKSYGADVLVDYRDEDVVSKLKAATGNSIEYGLDGISEKGSVQQAQLAFGLHGGTLITVLGNYGELPRTDVKVITILSYTLLGEDVQFGPTFLKADSTLRAQYTYWLKQATALFGQGKVKPLPIEVVGGLEDVQTGFDLMSSGKHNCKLVYTVAHS